ncbi:MAG: M48 family metalloprotease [Planctomycetota bacterium]
MKRVFANHPTRVFSAIVATVLLGLAWTTGCRMIESTADSLSTASEGTALAPIFGGVARAAESMRDYSPAEEHYIGRSVAAEILSRYRVHPDAELQRYVQLVGHAVLAAPEARKTLTGYHFVVLEGDELQAVSTPGGFVFLTAGTVRRARDEDELSSVIAHEIAHVTLNHGIKSIKAATRKKSLALLMQGVGQGVSEGAGAAGGEQQLAELAVVFADAIQDITSDLLVKGYTRETELEADKLALTLLQASGYARSGLKGYLEAMDASSAGGSKAGGGGGWYATHPTAEARIACLGAAGAANADGRETRRARFAATVKRG